MADARRKKGLIAPKQPAPLFIAPVQTGEKPADRGIDPLAGREFPLELETVAPGGELLARSGGISFYVDVGCPGQKVLAKVISSSRGNAQARRLQVVEPAPGQAEAFCPHFGVCGGCQWQEIPYPVQLELKQEALTRALINIGGFAPELLKSLMLPPAPSPQIRDFRARMEFAFSLDEQTSFKSASPGAVSKKYPAAKEEGGRTLLGLRRRGAHAVVEVEACPVAPASFLEILREVRAWVKSSGLSAYVPGETGIAGRVLRFLNLRISRLSGKIAVELITFPSPNNARKIAALGKALLERPDICSFTHMTREAEDYLAVGEQTVL
ncbi:MAG: hypothetical protein IJD04_03310, partial [Desulfovibrionaceae bacterium]|nr:hypothetical protein [Desulfovibrionaceae bacterium]